MTDKALAICYKDYKTVKTFYDVKNISYDHKYNYWILTQCISHHDIITIHKPLEFDKVEVVSKGEFGKEIIKEIKP